jgi:Rad3-related DNA helicase
VCIQQEKKKEEVLMQLRPSQQQALDFALANSGGKTAIVAPTAAGKTIISKAIAGELVGRVAILTYSNDLVHQFIKAFPEVPVIIASKHYPDKAMYMSHVTRAKTAKAVLFNAASYVAYMQKPEAVPFDHVVLDEADSCLSLLQLQTGHHYDWGGELTVSEAQVRQTACDNPHFLRNSQEYYWEVEETFDKKTQSHRRTLILRSLKLQKSFLQRIFPQSIVAMSATLFDSDLNELFYGEKYEKLSLPSPIPVENRRVTGFCDEKYPETPEGLLSLLSAVLETHSERPAIVHTTYAESKVLADLGQLYTYETKEGKMPALKALEGTTGVLLTPGAAVGLDLKYEKCRLNIILRGCFSNLGSDYVRRRKAIEPSWYTEFALKQLVQACGRSTRLPDDSSKIVVCDNRLIQLAASMADSLPEYFRESCTFI